MDSYARQHPPIVDRSALRRAVTSCVVGHDRLIGRLRAVVATGRTNLDWTDLVGAEACPTYREFTSILPAQWLADEAFERTAIAHASFHRALGVSLGEAPVRAPQASASLDVGGALVVAAELLRAALYEWIDET